MPVTTRIQKGLQKTKKMVKKTTCNDKSVSSPKMEKTPSEATFSTVTSPIVVEQPSDSEPYEEKEEEEEYDDDETQFSNTSKELLPDITQNSLTEIATTSAALGLLFGFALAASFLPKARTAPLYIMALSTFHFLEFWITAKYNPTRVHSESFIINNGSAYTIAHTFALIETALEAFFFPDFKDSYTWIKALGFVMTVFGQIVRTVAMKTAGKSFNHLVQMRRADDHELVTTGIYSYSRHPSYFGFFWWAIGTQLMLLNPVSLVGFALVLHNFFSDRIFHEEKFLIQFFGEKYETYKKSTPVYIPFIA